MDTNEEPNRQKKVTQPKPKLYGCKKAAAYLGIPLRSFYRLKLKHKIFQPAQTEFSSGPRYHVEQLRLITSVIIGTLTPDDAMDLWDAKKTVIAFKGADDE